MKLLPKEGYKKTFYIGVGAVLLLTIVGVGTAFFYKGSGYILVGKDKITKAQYEKLLAKYNSDTASMEADEKKVILEKAVEASILRQEGEKLGITVSDKDIKDYLSAQGVTTETYDRADENEKFTYRTGALVEILKPKVSEKVVGAKEGQVAIARFDRYLERDDTDPAKTAADKEHAKAKIEEYLAQVKAGTKTFKEMMDALDSDPQTGKQRWNGSYDFSFDLTPEEYKLKGTLSGSKSFWDAVSSQPEGMSDVILCKDRKSVKDGPIEEMDAFYAVVNITKASSGASSYNEWLKNKMSEYKVNLDKGIS
jgi:hypothetical protein